LYGIARDVLRQGHTAPVWLFHGALSQQGLYLTEELSTLREEFSNFHYVRSVLNGEVADGIEVGALDQCILSRFKSLAGHKAYVCGDPVLVNMLRKKLFLAGMASKSIYADSFLPSA
jgi:CDP-4-dehydro-6-deoxyglucose reductase, E3